MRIAGKTLMLLLLGASRPIAGEIRQQLAGGLYTLRVTVNDAATGRTAVQSTVFTVK